MEQQFLQSFMYEIKSVIDDAYSDIKCVAFTKSGKKCTSKAPEGRFCKKHVHLESSTKYMIRPGANMTHIYHDHPPNVECEMTCPRC